MKEKAKKELERIETLKKSWKSDFMREMEIWKFIAHELNGSTGDELKYWQTVMDLYHKKYKK